MSMFKQFFVIWIVILSFLSVLAAQLDGVIQVSLCIMGKCSVFKALSA